MENNNIFDNIFEYIDEHRSVEYIWVVVTILALIIGFAIDTLSMVQLYPWAWIPIIIYIFFSMWLFLGRRIFTLRRELNELREFEPQLWDLQTTVADIVAHHKAKALYEIEKWKIEYIIDEHGNGQYSRQVSFRLSPANINIFMFRWGTNTKSAARAAEEINLETYFTIGNSKEEHPVKAVPYEYYDGGVRFVCLLPILENDEELVTIHISGQWEGMYLPLVETNQDRNTIDVFTPTKELEIKLTAPMEKVFTGLHIIPPIPNQDIKKRKRHPSSITFTARDIPQNNYQYMIHWEDR